VTNRIEWAQIALELYVKDLPKLKDFYFQYLYPYEQKYYFGKDADNDLPNMICGHPRKMVKVDQSNANQSQQNIQQSQNLNNAPLNSAHKSMRL
jgi:hypothetical protein